MSHCSFPLKEKKSWLLVMTCILDICRHLVCISMAMCSRPPHHRLQHRQEPSPYWRSWKFWGHFRVIRKVPRTWGTEYRGQKSKVGTITIYVYREKKKEKEKKRKEGTELTSNSEYWVQGPKAKVGMITVYAKRGKKKKKNGKKRGPNWAQTQGTKYRGQNQKWGQ